MKKVTTGQANWGPANKPTVVAPVIATLAVPVYYNGGDGLRAANGIFCADLFASTVLTVMEGWAKKYGFGIVDLGVYNPRMARHMDGTPIIPARWSNHAFGLAMDFDGIMIVSSGAYLNIAQMQAGCPAKLKELVDGCTAAIIASGRKPEIVPEGGTWIHIGIWTETAASIPNEIIPEQQKGV
jgi:hypothetical protein